MKLYVLSKDREEPITWRFTRLSHDVYVATTVQLQEY